MNTKIKTGLGIIIILILVTTIGVFVWQVQKKQQRMSNIDTGQVSEQADNQELTLDISNWKTFRHDKCNYELKYPEDWKLSNKEEFTWTVVEKGNCLFSVYEISKDYLDQETAQKEDLIKKGCYSKAMIINDTSFEKIECPEKLLSAPIVLGEYYFQNNDKYFKIGLADYSGLWKAKNQTPPDNFKVDCKKYLNQILSTFKFIN